MSKKPSLADIRAKYKQKIEGKKKDFGNTNNDVYPHWNIEENATATVRILPDKNEDNEDNFFIEKLEHKLSINGKDRKIPCIKMWGEKCPICELSAKYYKADKAAGNKDSVQGKYYYFKRTSLMKALITKDPISYEGGGESAVGQVKTLQFTYQLMNLINAALAEEDEEKALTALPWDLDEGYNFVIKKTKQGEYDNYSTGSGFSNKVTGIPEQYREAVEAGMVDLSTLLPANPGLEAVQKLLEAHLSGDDVEDEEEDDKPVKRKVVETVEDDDDVPVKRRKPVVEEEAEEEAPVAKKRKPVVEEEEEEAPVVKKKKPVVEEEEEEVAPVVKKKVTPAPVADDDEDEDAALIAKIRARKNA